MGLSNLTYSLTSPPSCFPLVLTSLGMRAPPFASHDRRLALILPASSTGRRCQQVKHLQFSLIFTDSLPPTSQDSRRDPFLPSISFIFPHLHTSSSLSSFYTPVYSRSRPSMLLSCPAQAGDDSRWAIRFSGFHLQVFRPWCSFSASRLLALFQRRQQ